MLPIVKELMSECSDLRIILYSWVLTGWLMAGTNRWLLIDGRYQPNRKTALPDRSWLPQRGAVD